MTSAALRVVNLARRTGRGRGSRVPARGHLRSLTTVRSGRLDLYLALTAGIAIRDTDALPPPSSLRT